jgi:hypothetical protein
MLSRRTWTDHRIRFTGIALMVATLLLAACGDTRATIAPAVRNGQAELTPTSVPASVSATVRQSVPTTPPAAIATVAASATTPAAIPDANAGPVTGTIDPCVLITKADYLAAMSDAANDPVKKNTPLPSAGITRSSCEYKIAAGGKVEFVTVNVMQRTAGAAAPIDIKTFWEGTKKAWASMQAEVTPLPEIGPEVFLVVNPTLEQIGAGGAVRFLKGDVIVDVQAVTGSGTVDEQNAAGIVAAKKLATMAFGRL